MKMYESEEKWEEAVKEEEGRVLKMAYEKLDTLYAKIRDLTGLNDLKFESVLDDEKGTLRFESENIAEKDRLIRIAWERMTIGSWHCYASAGKRICDDNYYYSGGRPDLEIEVKGTGEVNTQIDYRYIHIDGGSNGAYIARASFTEKDGWQIKHTYKDRKW